MKKKEPTAPQMSISDLVEDTLVPFYDDEIADVIKFTKSKKIEGEIVDVVELKKWRNGSDQRYISIKSTNTRRAKKLVFEPGCLNSGLKWVSVMFYPGFIMVCNMVLRGVKNVKKIP